MKSWLRLTSLLLGFVALAIFFQNCSQSGFSVPSSMGLSSSAQSSESETESSEQPSPTPVPAPTPAPISPAPTGPGFTLIRNFNGGNTGVQTSSADGFDDADGGSYYSSVQSAEGGKAVELNIGAGEEGFGKWGGIIYPPENLPKNTEIWYRVKMFWPTGFNYNANPWLKFLRVHTASPQQSNQGYNDWYIANTGTANPFQFIFEGEQMWSTFGSATDVIKFDVWETYEMYLYLDDVPVSKGGKARIRVWKNGQLMKDITDRKTLVSSDSYANGFYLFTYWNGNAPKTQKAYADDIVITTQKPAGRDALGNPYIGTGTIK